jgi:DNA-binding PadR family transcriptional regulator
MSRNYNRLPQVAFNVLMALSLRERHGYEIIKQIEEDTRGRIKLGPGALYTSIRHLHEHGLIEEIEKQTDKNRRYYRLTANGKTILNDELSYYETMLGLAKKRHITQD